MKNLACFYHTYQITFYCHINMYMYTHILHIYKRNKPNVYKSLMIFTMCILKLYEEKVYFIKLLSLIF